MASKIRTILGLTIRDDKKQLLMGKALLKAHEIEKKRYDYFAYFSSTDYFPIEEQEVIEKFKKVFDLKRSSETGFSLVIPDCVEEFTNNYKENIKKAVILNYYYPIFFDRLNVEIFFNEKKLLTINSENIQEIALNTNWSDTNWKGINVGDVFRFLNEIKNLDPIEIDIGNNYELPENFASDELKNKFANEQPLRFKIKIRLPELGDSHFDIYIKKMPNFSESFVDYYRSDISIVKERKLKKRPVAALLVASDEKIKEFLGLSETPAHTEWNPNTNAFKAKFGKAGKDALLFIKKVLLEIYNRLSVPEEKNIKDLLIDIFYLESSMDEKNRKKKKTSLPPGVPLLSKEDKILVTKTRDGFSISINKNLDGNDFPLKAKLMAAYATIIGDPFANYDPFDFRFDSDMLEIRCFEGKVTLKEKNTLRFIAYNQNFNLRVTGFDINRDLVVKIDTLKDEKAD